MLEGSGLGEWVRLGSVASGKCWRVLEAIDQLDELVLYSSDEGMNDSAEDRVEGVPGGLQAVTPSFRSIEAKTHIIETL